MVTLTDNINTILNTSNFVASEDELKVVIQVLNISPTYPIILVGGTNGKGSTCAYLTTILVHAGYNVGTFTSPHLFEYNERIKVNNTNIDNETLNNVLEKILNYSNTLGLFKTFTLASHLIFQEKKIDIAIVEVGLGGKNDPTNLFEPYISAITGVDYDHCDILGESLEKIGKEKSGIYRSNKYALYGSQNPPTSITNAINNIGAIPYLFSHDFDYKRNEYSWNFISQKLNLYSLPFPSMRGKEQLDNATLAIAILSLLRDKFPVNSSQIKNGLLQTSLIGRFQVMPGTPQIVFDTAHNEQAVETMYNNVLKLHYAKRNFALFGIAEDKNWQNIIKKHAKNFDHWFVAPIKSVKSVDAIQIKELLRTLGIKDSSITISNSIADSFETAYKQLKSDDRLVCFGSFLTIEEAYKTFQGIRI